MEKYEFNNLHKLLSDKVSEFKKISNYDSLISDIKALDIQMSSPSFWDDSQKAQAIISSANKLKTKKQDIDQLLEIIDDIDVLMEFYKEDNDESIYNDAVDKLNELDQLISEYELKILLNEEYDDADAILELHPGAGGTESQDWCEMLYRMYSRWVDKKKYKMTVLDYQVGDEAGIKSVTVEISGLNAYGYLKAEKGVHRLVRISPFDSNSRRHTSFVSCDVLPKIDDSIEIDIDPGDLKIDTYRSSGAGGQSVNTTDSAVRITHLPTKTVVTCQNERSQIKNREMAMKILKSRLFTMMLENQKKEISELRGDMKDIAWGSQIRSYVFHPYSMVKDHRTNYETSNPQAVMDGNIDEFINEYLKYYVEKKSEDDN